MTKEFFKFDGECSEDLFIRCYEKALVLAEEHDVDVSEHHDCILQALCSACRYYAGRSDAYAMINSVLHNRIHYMARGKGAREIPSGLLEVECVWDDTGLDVERVLEYVRRHIGDLSCELLRAFIDIRSCSEVARRFGLTRPSAEYHLQRAQRYARKYVIMYL